MIGFFFFFFGGYITSAILGATANRILPITAVERIKGIEIDFMFGSNEVIITENSPRGTKESEALNLVFFFSPNIYPAI